MTTTTLKRWGNSQGVIIPKASCDEANITIDDTMEVRVDRRAGVIILSPVRNRYHRSTKLTASEVFADWNKPYECPPDLAGTQATGREADWGSPIGNEAW